MSRPCPHCGAQLPMTDDAFCSDCNGELDAETIARNAPAGPATPVSPQYDQVRKIWIYMLIIGGLKVLTRSHGEAVDATIVVAVILIAVIVWLRQSQS